MIGPGEPRPDLCVVVVNNDGGGIFEGLEPAGFGGGVSGRPQAGPAAAAAACGRTTHRPSLTLFERIFGTPHGASIEHLAAAFGLPYTLAERPGDLAKALAATVPGTGPRIVEARTAGRLTPTCAPGCTRSRWRRSRRRERPADGDHRG